MTTAIVADLREIILHRFKTAPLRELLDLHDDRPMKPMPLIVPRFEVDDDIVTDHVTGLTWLRDYVPGGKRPWKESIDAASKLDLRGWKWRAPEVSEQLSIVDYTRHSPAFDTDAFKGGSDWVWTSTPDAESPSGGAWGVNFSNGYSSRSYRVYGGFVRAVRVGQF